MFIHILYNEIVKWRMFIAQVKKSQEIRGILQSSAAMFVRWIKTAKGRNDAPTAMLRARAQGPRAHE